MSEPDPRAEELQGTRRHLKRKLGPYRHHLRRLVKHIDHMEQADLDRLHALADKLEGREAVERGEILKMLRSIHDIEQCQMDMEREGLLKPERPKTGFWATVWHRLG